MNINVCIKLFDAADWFLLSGASINFPDGVGAGKTTKSKDNVNLIVL